MSARAGMKISVSSSLGWRWVRRGPRMKSSSGMLRSPAALASLTRAPRAISAGTPSAAGEALHRFPPTVPRFCTWMPPTFSAQSLRPSKSGGRSACATSVQMAPAPMRQPPSTAAMPRISATALTSSMGAAIGLPTLAA